MFNLFEFEYLLDVCSNLILNFAFFLFGIDPNISKSYKSLFRLSIECTKLFHEALETVLVVSILNMVQINLLDHIFLIGEIAKE